MKNLLSLLLVLVFAPSFALLAQDNSKERSKDQANKEQVDSKEASEKRAFETDEEPPENWIKIDHPRIKGAKARERKYDDERPPLVPGDSGDRVSELQATLNGELSGQTIKLQREVYVGPLRGAINEDNPMHLHRTAIVRDGDTVFRFDIRGDWTPLDYDRDTYNFEKAEKDFVARAYWIKLPDAPLKIDGVYGQHTQAGVALFQIMKGLTPTGEVDVVTLDKLEPLVPRNRILAMIMNWYSVFKSDWEYHALGVKILTAITMTIFILVSSVIIYQIAKILSDSTSFLSRWLFTPTSSPWFTAMRKNHVFRRIALFVPALFIYLSATKVFPEPNPNDLFPYLNTFQDWHVIVTRIGLAYMSLVFMWVGFAFAGACDTVYNPDSETENPIGALIRAAKRAIGLLGTILICASLMGKSPFLIVGSLGAFMAVFMLVFRDYLLGLVSSVQIIGNRVVEVGDWITMPKYNADGDVQEISLTLIKVQNFDKTISTIPTNAVLTESFQNWSGMRESGGRRIKRSLLIDVRGVRVCDDEMIERFQKIELIKGYVFNKLEELAEYNRRHDVEASPINSRRLTNIGTFRAYLHAYLSEHPDLSKELTFLVRHLQPTNNGLPVEIYAFCKETDWAKFEDVQADIFDHLLAALPEFGLRPFQEITEGVADVEEVSTQTQSQVGLAELEGMIETANSELQNNARTRPSPRVEKIRQRIDELGLHDTFAVNAEDRTIRLHHLNGQ